MNNLQIRRGTSRDLVLLERMLFEAFFWQPDQERPDAAEFLQQPQISRLLQDWGRPGDAAVVAQVDGREVGAAWCRLWTDSDHSYGFVNAQTPELGIALEHDFRGQGIGRMLLRSLSSHTRKEGFSALSLSVAPDNFARRLYESEGFVKVGESGTSWTLVRTFERES